MFIIWGWRTRLSVKETGVFFSPATGCDGPYELVQARTWFTLFFLPLIPLKVKGMYVRCGVTKELYDPRVLDNPTTADFATQLAGALREIVAAVVIADSTAGDEETSVAIDRLAGQVPGYNRATLDADIASLDADQLRQRLSYLAGSLSTDGKEQLLSTAAAVMAAGPARDDGTRRLVQSIGESLGMSPAHVLGVIGAAEAAADKA